MSAVETKTLYEERIGFPLVRGAVALFAALTIIYWVMYLYQRINGELGENPLPLWFAVTILSTMALFTFMLANLMTLSIKITEKSAVIAFGIFRARVRCEDIRGCDLDRTSSFLSFANWGVSMGFVGGRWRRMFNVIGYQRVVIEMKRGRKAVVFSTKNPDGVMNVIRQHVGNHEKQETIS